ncbi:PAS domain-containing protein, partial [bacterium BMS3Abin03]|nr:PAS domain-containing protein [bacterium BMS3Abin03]
MKYNTAKIFNQMIDRFEDEFYWYEDHTGKEEFLVYSSNVFYVTGYTNEELVEMPGKGREIILDEDLSEMRETLEEFRNDSTRNSISMEFW